KEDSRPRVDVRNALEPSIKRHLQEGADAIVDIRCRWTPACSHSLSRAAVAEFPDRDPELLRLIGKVALDAGSGEDHDADRQHLGLRTTLGGEEIPAVDHCRCQRAMVDQRSGAGAPG